MVLRTVIYPAGLAYCGRQRDPAPVTSGVKTGRKSPRMKGIKNMSNVEPSEGDPSPGVAWLKIDSFDDLIKHEKEIIDQIEKTPNGPNLFMIHPFLLLAEIGVQLRAAAKTTSQIR